MEKQLFDVIGIGAGPFNLSVAALLHPLKGIQQRFFERQQQFSWHPGMLLDNSTVQNSFLKDLVSFADPTSPFSFLAFLHERKRLYEYVNAGFQRTSRQEFNQYLQWAAQKLPSVQWGADVSHIAAHPLGFEVSTQNMTCIARNLVVGTGPRPSIPAMASHLLGGRVFHSSAYLMHRAALASKRVAVIGGGQSGAEIVLDLLRQREAPREIIWINSRAGFSPLDESHFANELYTPAYVEYFWGLDKSRKRQLLEQQTLTSDGISPETLQALYQQLYQQRFLGQGTACHLMNSRRVEHIHAETAGYVLQTRVQDTGQQELHRADKIVLATGYRQDAVPAVLEGLADRLGSSAGELDVNLDFSLDYQGAGKVFLLNAARHSHGVSEPNLSVNAWRAASIVNAILGHEHYPCPHSRSMLSLDGPEPLAGVA